MKLIIDKASYLLSLIKDYLDLARIEVGELQMQILGNIKCLKDIINPCIEMIKIQAQEKKMNIDMDVPKDDITIQCDPEIFKGQMQMLIETCAKNNPYAEMNKEQILSYLRHQRLEMYHETAEN